MRIASTKLFPETNSNSEDLLSHFVKKHFLLIVSEDKVIITKAIKVRPFRNPLNQEFLESESLYFPQVGTVRVDLLAESAESLDFHAIPNQ